MQSSDQTPAQRLEQRDEYMISAELYASYRPFQKLCTGLSKAAWHVDDKVVVEWPPQDFSKADIGFTLSYEIQEARKHYKLPWFVPVQASIEYVLERW